MHLADGELEVLSSPVSAVEVENIVGGTGSVALTLLNTGDEVWNARLEAGAVPGLVVSPREEEVAIRPGRRRKVKFDCRLEAGAKGSVFELPVTLRLPNNVELTRGCRIGVSASGAAGEVPENFVLAAGDALDGFAPELKLDRIEQAVFGRPSDTASIQEAHFWGGPPNSPAVSGSAGIARRFLWRGGSAIFTRGCRRCGRGRSAVASSFSSTSAHRRRGWGKRSTAGTSFSF